MKKSQLAAAMIIMFVLGTVAAGFAQTADDIQKHASCKYCNMDRQQFAHSRFLITYDDGTVFPACSIHCAAVDLAINLDRTPASMQVGDYSTKQLIDAEAATWVIGGNKPGVMTKRAKWAFAKKDDAEKYVQENGGALASFDEAIKATYEDMNDDTKMIREKRKAKRMQMQGGKHQ